MKNCCYLYCFKVLFEAMSSVAAFHLLINRHSHSLQNRYLFQFSKPLILYVATHAIRKHTQSLLRHTHTLIITSLWFMWWWSALQLAAESVFKTYCTETITIATNESQYREEHIKDRNGPNYAKLSQLKLLKHSWDYTLYFSLSLSLSALSFFYLHGLTVFSGRTFVCNCSETPKHSLSTHPSLSSSFSSPSPSTHPLSLLVCLQPFTLNPAI